MTAKQLPVDFPEVQRAIYGVALSLDSLLVNGIPYGVFLRAMAPSFLEMRASNLMRDLASLEEQVPHVPDTSQPRVAELLASLRARCQQIVDLVSGLTSFRTIPLEQVRSTVRQIPPLRGECVRLIQELEACLHTPRPFYQSRPGDSTADVNAFLANLERAFAEEWAATNADERPQIE